MIESRRKLFAEDCRQFGLRGWRYATARCVSQVGLDSRLYSDPWLLGSLGNWALARGIRRGEGQIRFCGKTSCRQQSLAQLTPKFFGLLPARGLGALANELAVERSPYPLGAATPAPCLIAGVLTVWMVAGIDGKHEHPDFSEILLESPNWGKLKFSRPNR